MKRNRYLLIRDHATGEKKYLPIVNDPHYLYKPRQICKKRFKTASAAHDYSIAVQERWRRLREARDNGV